ncbi:MAG: hypothetical protein GW855_08670 [Erythrobacter sp.]|nr:hypothetical protein [Erythrobacter sp.]NCQ64465.1 hypothetical protein [Alphaproteobacteria bacterium]
MNDWIAVMITILGRRNSSSVQLVMWAINEIGVEFERLDYGHGFATTNTPAYLAMNPMGRVPVLQDGLLLCSKAQRYCATLVPHTAAKRSGRLVLDPALHSTLLPNGVRIPLPKESSGYSYTKCECQLLLAILHSWQQPSKTSFL